MSLNLVLAVTGASGAIYAVRLLDVLLGAGCDVNLSISPSGQAVLRHELGLNVDLDAFHLESLLPERPQLAEDARYQALRTLVDVASWRFRAAAGKTIAADAAPRLPGRVHYQHYQDFMAPMASGSAKSDGMVVCPCSGGTLSAIAHGASSNLIQRAADVHLKERRKLILVPRETPLSLVHLDTMRRATKYGAIVLPAMPGFYHGATCVRDLVDFVVARICDQLGVEHALMVRWGE